MTQITDHGEFDFLTPTEPSEADKLIAKFAREAIEAHLAHLNGDQATQAENLANDLRMYGTAFSVAGKRIDPEDVYRIDE